MKSSGRYQPLHERLRKSGERELTLSFAAIEALIGGALPESARRGKAWWSNRDGGVQAKAWMSAGYHVRAVDLERERVTFGKPAPVYNIRREGDTVLWDGALVKALRLHMGLSQSAFARVLGVRQQTVSEWEKGIYLPTLATSKHLGMVAEQANFSYTIPQED